MTVRHLVDEAHVEDGMVTDPSVVRHGSVRAGKVEALAGTVDLEAHRDPSNAHGLDRCLVVEELEVGSPVLVEGDEWKWAGVGVRL